MSEIKTTVSLSDLINLEEGVKKVPVTLDDGKVINVTPVIGALATEVLVDMVVNSSYDKNGNYSPMLREYSLAFAMLVAYTDIDMDFDPEDELYYEKLNRLMFETDIVEGVILCINQKQRDFIYDAIDQKIMLRNHSDIERVSRQLNELTNMINAIGGDLKGMMAGISEEDIANVINAMKDGKIDEGKLVQAYAKQPTKKKSTKKKAPTAKLELTDVSAEEMLQ